MELLKKAALVLAVLFIVSIFGYTLGQVLRDLILQIHISHNIDIGD
jgi:preprotein translocase subunit SecE